MSATITGTVKSVQRLGHTVYGNPMMQVILNTEDVSPEAGYAVLRISNDASLVYEIENPEYADTPHVFAITRAGRISHVLKGIES